MEKSISLNIDDNMSVRVIVIISNILENIPIKYIGGKRKMGERVFCKDCKYLIKVSDECKYPDNISDKKRISVNWYEKTEWNNYLSKPYKINKNNDCEWYEKKGNK